MRIDLEAQYRISEFICYWMYRRLPHISVDSTTEFDILRQIFTEDKNFYDTKSLTSMFTEIEVRLFMLLYRFSCIEQAEGVARTV